MKTGQALTERQADILALLAEYKGLTTRQIGSQVLPEAAHRQYILRELGRLEKMKMIRCELLEPHRGQASPRLWMLLKGGADAIAAPYGSQFYRSIPGDQVQHKSVVLELCRQVADAGGWELIKPQHYNSFHPRPNITPQAAQLIQAVLRKSVIDRRTLESQAWQIGHDVEPTVPILPVSAILDAGSDLGAGVAQNTWIVPTYVNDYVAYRPDEPGQAVVFILHPPRAGRQFWTRTRPPKRGHPGRLEVYRRVAKVITVAAVFGEEHEARVLAEAIKPSGVRVFLVSGVRGLLGQIAGQRT